MPNLKLTPTDDLIKELNSRFDCTIFAAHSNTTTKGDYFMGRSWSGNEIICAGMASMLVDQIVKKMNATSSKIGEPI